MKKSGFVTLIRVCLVIVTLPSVALGASTRLSESFDKGWLKNGKFIDLGRQVRDFRDGRAVAITSKNAGGEHGFIASKDAISRKPGRSLVYRTKVLAILPPEKDDGSLNGALVGAGPEVRSFIGVVSGEDERAKIPYFEADAVLLTFEGDFAHNKQLDVATLSKVTLVLSAKQAKPATEVNSQKSVKARWEFTRLPVFPIELELTVGESALAVRVIGQDGKSFPLKGSKTTLTHGFTKEWLKNGHVVLGAENIDGHAGASAFDSLTVSDGSAPTASRSSPGVQVSVGVAEID